MNIVDSSIGDVSDKLRRGEISAVEIVQQTLARIAATEETVHAFSHVDRDGALQRAEDLDRDAKSGRWAGILHGIPISVKDIFATNGTPTTAGSAVLENNILDYDAKLVSRLRAAGAIIIGKTVTHEFAYGQNSPATRNAWDTRCYPGGSSAGSAVSVAVGTSFGSIGSDTGGSIRIPAALNGVVGLKPTHGRISRHGSYPMSPSLDCPGPLARTVRDCAILLHAIAGHDRDDRTTIDVEVEDFPRNLSRPIAGMRLGIDREYYLDAAISSEGTALFDAALSTLKEHGCTVVDVSIPSLQHSVAAGMSILLGDASEWHSGYVRSRMQDYDANTLNMLLLGEAELATAYVRSQKIRTIVRDDVKSTFTAHALDGLIAPSTPRTTLPVEDLSVHLENTEETVLSTFLKYNFAANLIGIPALSVPIGFSSSGKPFGAQILTRPFDEPTGLRIGYHLQRSLVPEPTLPDWLATSAT